MTSRYPILNFFETDAPLKRSSSAQVSPPGVMGERRRASMQRSASARKTRRRNVNDVIPSPRHKHHPVCASSVPEHNDRGAQRTSRRNETASEPRVRVTREFAARSRSRRITSHPRQEGRVNYVAKSSFCTQNPFRVQTFTDFTINPDYSCPSTVKDYKAVATTAGLEGLRAVKMDSIQAIKDQFKKAAVEQYTPLGKVTLDEMIMYLCAGEWFWKWGLKHIWAPERWKKRYFWLNGDKCALMWSVSDSVISFSQLNLRSVVKMTPDCISINNKVIYRMTLHAEKTLLFGTEHRILFDQWYAVLRYIISPNDRHGAPGLWKRPSVSTTTVEGRWASRYSSLQSELMEDARRKGQSTAWTD